MKILTNGEVPKEVLDAIMGLATDMAVKEDAKEVADKTTTELDESSITHVSPTGKTLCHYPVTATEEEKELASGFIKAGINPFTGKKLELGRSPLFEVDHRILSSVGDMMAQYKKETTDSYQPISPADVAAVRNILRHAFASYAYNAINQVVNYANFDFSERVKNAYSSNDLKVISNKVYEFTRYQFSDIDDKIFRVFDIDEIVKFSPRLHADYKYRVCVKEEEPSIFSGALLDLVNYMTYDLGTILLMVIPIMETSYNRFFDMININFGSDYFEGLLSIYNESQTVLIAALENVITMLYREALIYAKAGGPGLIGCTMDQNIDK